MRAPCLLVVAGPDAGCEFVANGPAIRVGRARDVDLRLADAAVSRHHLTLALLGDAEALVVEEIPGINPVWVLRGAERVRLMPQERLTHGTRIVLGNTTLELLWRDVPRRRSTFELDADLADPSNRPPHHLAALAALGETLARCRSLEAVFREATAWAVETLPAARALLLSPDGRDVLSTTTDPETEVALSQALLQRVLRDKRAFLVNDIMEDPNLRDRRSIQMRNLVGALAAPAQNLIFYADWGTREAARGMHAEETLLLAVCAAHLLSALGESVSARSALEAAAKSSPHRRPGTRGAPRLIGHSAALQRLQVFIERVAPTPATILLRGESGTGKELVAELIHNFSAVHDGPFVAVNCAAIPEQLLESELFGHEKGAFTGAVSQHEGYFAQAHGGTLFLDEIGEMSPSTQARMLRVLETRRFMRVGGTSEVHVDVRLVAATHRDLAQMVNEGTFRHDLLFRLSVITTVLPPLRERPEDIEPLVHHFVAELGQQMGRQIVAIAPEALLALRRYAWPGNVRELRNVVERALVLGEGSTLRLGDLPPELTLVRPPGPAPDFVEPAPVRPLAEVEREAIETALQATDGNKARAAALLGIDRTTLYRKLRESER